MRRTFFTLLLLGTGCIAGKSTLQRDDRLLREIARQERWAQQALDARPDKEQLESIREGDYGSVGAARKELQKLIQAVERATWIRETTAELMHDDDDPQLVQGFDRAGRLRNAALQAADELADALAEAKGGLTIADLRPAFEAVRKAQASDDRLAKLPLRPSAPRLAPAPLPVPRPFHEAAAKVIAANQDQAKIRARLSELDREKEEQKHAAPPPPAVIENSTEQASEAQAPSTTLKIAGDAASLIAKKAPSSITLREDGLFALSYPEGDYLVDPDGKLVRKEPADPSKPRAPKK
jgi:hypothetical protein